MDWQSIQRTLCAAREFAQVHDGYRVLADTLMPSGGLIHVHIQMRDGVLSMHDNGAAFDELALYGAELKSNVGIRRFLGETAFELTNDGTIFRHGIAPEDVAVGVSLVADASLRAANFMLSHAKIQTGQPLDVRLKAAMIRRYPSGRANFKFDGKARQQRFDYGLEIDDQVVLVEAVSPDLSSVNAAIVKSLDARNSIAARARPILVYDERDHWPADALNLLAMAGERVSFKSIDGGQFKIAA